MAPLVIVTGASRGLGRAIAVGLARAYEQASFVLLARDAAALAETRSALLENGAKSVDVHAVDMSAAAGLGATLRAILPPASADCDRALLINNAGSLGDVTHKVEDLDEDAMDAYFALNITSVAMLTTIFLRTYRAVPARAIVNISSLLAVQAHPYWGLYCAGKAARDHLHAVVAVEGKSSNTRTLNYAPGPLEGEMQEHIRTSIGDAEQRSIYSSMHEKGQLVPMDASAGKLVRLLVDDTFQSGAHVDYFDLP